MKRLVFNNRTYKADVIYKENNNIIGEDNNGNTIFEIRGITRIDDITLENGDSFNVKATIEERFKAMQKAIDDLTIGGM